MKSGAHIKSHGGTLIDLVVDDERKELLKDLALTLPDIALNERQLCDLELLATGVFSPLEGFMVRSDYEAVLDRMRLQNDLIWPMPICLDLPEMMGKSLEVGQSVALRDPEGFLLAVMHIEDIWTADKQKEAQQVYGTTDKEHSGVRYLYDKTGDYYIGGKLEVLNLPIHFDLKKLRMLPAEVRGFYQKMDWKRVVGFQTRQPIHRAHFEMTIKAMQKAKANLLLLPVTGVSQPGDFDHYTRVKCYRAITPHYPPDSVLLNLLPLSMRMAGPREAILHTIVAKNFGCSHFIIGTHHASPGNGDQNEPIYNKDEARKTVEVLSDEIGVDILPFEEIVYLPFEDEFRSINQIPDNAQTISLSGDDFRKRILSGRRIPEWATFPEVLEVLHQAYPAPRKQGFSVFLTGLSGAGKSTIAKVLYSRFLEIGDRPVSLLDGDVVRQNLSSELSFSKEHRDVNVRRIGFVASEITKNRGIAICAPIAPYNITRTEIRNAIEGYGGFIEVHVATPLEVCEKRDRKGMYAKAKAGLIKGFTGVDDPYEVPKNPEVRIDTTEVSPDEAVQEVMLFLSQKGYI